MLRSWEAEFPDLGVAKTAGGPRVYRRADLEFVLRIKHLLFVEGLTLAGARRKLFDEQPNATGVTAGLRGLDALLGSDARERILQVKRGLRNWRRCSRRIRKGQRRRAEPVRFDAAEDAEARGEESRGEERGEKRREEEEIATDEPIDVRLRALTALRRVRISSESRDSGCGAAW